MIRRLPMELQTQQAEECSMANLAVMGEGVCGPGSEQMYDFPYRLGSCIASYVFL